jgi:hypothetical protein
MPATDDRAPARSGQATCGKPVVLGICIVSRAFHNRVAEGFSLLTCGMKSFIEKRKERRLNINVPAVLVIGDGLVRRPITIINLSRSGIMIELNAGFDVPSRFYLLFERKLQPCELVWQQGLFAGAKFDE